MPAVQGNYIPLSGQQRTLRTEIVWIFRRGSIRSGCTSPPSDPISTSFKPLSCTCRAPSPKIEQHAQARGPLQLTTDGTTTQHDNPTSQQLHSMLRTGPAGQILLHHAQDWHLLARSFFIMLKTGTCCSQLLRRAQLHQPPATITTATNNDSTPQRPASLHLSLAHQQPPQPRLSSHRPSASTPASAAASSSPTPTPALQQQLYLLMLQQHKTKEPEVIKHIKNSSVTNMVKETMCVSPCPPIEHFTRHPHRGSVVIPPPGRPTFLPRLYI